MLFLKFFFYLLIFGFVSLSRSRFVKILSIRDFSCFSVSSCARIYLAREFNILIFVLTNMGLSHMVEFERLIKADFEPLKLLFGFYNQRYFVLHHGLACYIFCSQGEDIMFLRVW